MKECIEFSWDEQTGQSYFVYENDYTGEITSFLRYQPMKKPEVTQELRDRYFANLKFWLDTQPLYD